MMQIPAEFDGMRPFEPEELPAAIEELLADEAFRRALAAVFPGVPFETLAAQMRACPDSLTLQKEICVPMITRFVERCCTQLDFNAAALKDKNSPYTFVSNHRDIVIDSAFLSYLLLQEGFHTTVEIAIGDNLLIYPWIRTLVRVNKSFVVERSASLRQKLASSARLGRYMHFAVQQKHDNLWIAQREGRAKDADDRTQDAVLKMMAMGGEGRAAERLAELHIVPLAISYEYDPCDVLKAAELQQRRDNPDFKKQPADDLTNMKTGIFGFKGRVHYEAAPCLDEWLLILPELPKNEFFETVARHIDRDIHLRYRLYPNNYAAADLLEGKGRFEQHYSATEKARFEQYVREKIEALEMPAKDAAFLRHMVFTMYANPLYNQLRAQQSAD